MAATRVDLFNGLRRRPSPVPPPYEHADSQTSASPPNYDLVAAASSFCATKTLHIDTQGHPLLALVLPPRAIPLLVYADDAGFVGNPAYQSVLRKGGEGALFRAGDKHPVCTTAAARIRLSGAVACNEEFELVGRGFATRSRVLRTHLGTFQWRYAGRRERRDAAAENLLVLERISSVALEGGRMEERRATMARLVRGEAGRGGGKLAMDLSEWAGDERKGKGEQVEVLIVASCLVMLKKEVNRRRMRRP